MNKTLLLAAIAGIATSSIAFNSNAAEPAKEKCYGISMAGKNDCKTANGSHSCAGQSKTDNDKNEWKYVSKGECEKMNGSLKAGS